MEPGRGPKIPAAPGRITGMTASFIPGRQLAREFYTEAVRPVLAEAYPSLPYSAALLGSGSEVLGFHSQRSTDHNWGPRLQVFLSAGDAGRRTGELTAIFAKRLPRSFRGYPTMFPVADQEGEARHWVEVADLGSWLTGQLGFDPRQPVTLLDWLATPTQRLAGVTAGEVFHDGLGELNQARSRLGWYPQDLWRYVLACQWQRIAQEEAFPGRGGRAGGPHPGCVRDRLGEPRAASVPRLRNRRRAAQPVAAHQARGSPGPAVPQPAVPGPGRGQVLGGIAGSHHRAADPGIAAGWCHRPVRRQHRRPRLPPAAAGHGRRRHPACGLTVTHSVTKCSEPTRQSSRSGPGAGGGKAKQPTSSACVVACGPAGVTNVTWPASAGVSWPTIPASSISISTLMRSPWKVSMCRLSAPLSRTSAPAFSSESSRPRTSSSASTVRQVNAAWAALMAVSSTGDSPSAARSSHNSSSSLHIGELTPVTSCPPWGGRSWMRVGSHRLRFPQPVKASPQRRANAADGHTHHLADLLIGRRRVTGPQPQQPLIPGRQLAQPVPQCLPEFGPQHVSVGVCGHALLHDTIGVRVHRQHSPPGPQVGSAFTLGGCHQPARQGRRLAQVWQVLHQPQPDRLADILRIRSAEMGTPYHSHHQLRVPAYQLVPGGLSAVRA